MPILPTLLAAATIATPAPGRWEVGTVVGGGMMRVGERCLSGSGDWVRDILPPALTAGCGAVERDRVTGCARGGFLAVTGSVFADRFDIVVTRAGPIGGNPRAAAALHIEGRRLSRDCATSGERGR